MSEIATELVDASPKIEVNNESLYQRIELQRDEVYRLLCETLEKFQLKGEITKSPPYDYETSVLIRLWKKEANGGGLQYRGEAKVILTANPIVRYPIVMQLTATSGGRKKTIKRIIKFDERAAYELIGFIATPGQKLRKSSFGRYGWLFNKNKFIKRPGQFRLKVLGALPVLGGMLFVVHPLVGMLGIGLGVLPIIFMGRKERVVSAGRPPQNPRELVRMDSWQSVVIDLGGIAEKIKSEVKHELVDGKHEDAVIENEEVAYLGPTGKAERKQIVISFRRAVAFIEVHGYGNDLYVDWEAYLNLGVWDETSAGYGYDTGCKARVAYKEMTRSLQALNEYDLSDANFLIEWVHACLTRVVRRLIKENKIDQEFDFRIQRSDRRAVLKEGESKAKTSRRSFSRKS